jgi:hypothetical protein
VCWLGSYLKIVNEKQVKILQLENAVATLQRDMMVRAIVYVCCVLDMMVRAIVYVCCVLDMIVLCCLCCSRGGAKCWACWA